MVILITGLRTIYGNEIHIKHVYVTDIIQFKFKQHFNKSCYTVGYHVEARLLLCKSTHSCKMFMTSVLS